MNIVPKKVEKVNNLSKQRCKSQMNTKIAKKTSKSNCHPPGKKTANYRYWI